MPTNQASSRTAPNMKLYLIRHATASHDAPTDEERQLTKEGHDEAGLVGRAMRALGAQPDHILSSPLVRALQTADALAHSLHLAKKVKVLKELANDHPHASLLRAIQPYHKDSEIILVGHEPSMSEHLIAFLGVKRLEAFPLGKASIACLETHGLEHGTGRLLFLLRQKQLRALAAMHHQK